MTDDSLSVLCVALMDFASDWAYVNEAEEEDQMLEPQAPPQAQLQQQQARFEAAPVRHARRGEEVGKVCGLWTLTCVACAAEEISWFRRFSAFPVLIIIFQR